MLSWWKACESKLKNQGRMTRRRELIQILQRSLLKFSLGVLTERLSLYAGCRFDTFSIEHRADVEGGTGVAMGQGQAEYDLATGVLKMKRPMGIPPATQPSYCLISSYSSDNPRPCHTTFPLLKTKKNQSCSFQAPQW
ncbi:hypothetical protein PGT21_001515 [Puccinia graminis f. sp. tritici]|uniref:Uncharacterized protein n=1 Tax=Puccinia graminis f. sp. tritici TaxID=56615 RepID=A0A5B0NHT9_PUCGR|nr:hypothetical protein PGTUg99_007842 [Puccinia graminis f. sp. tritici]KAA1105279.1 hypothetical protein PGT21_001515 [Puccinia graminis f. sp. tritici]